MQRSLSGFGLICCWRQVVAGQTIHGRGGITLRAAAEGRRHSGEGQLLRNHDRGQLPLA